MLAGAVVAARGRDGAFGVLTSDTSGGRIARQLIPWALPAPIVVGWAVSAGEHQGWYGDDGGDAA